MNAALLKRLFRAMQQGQPALTRVAGEIVQEQKRLGHTKLALQLEAVLQDQPQAPRPPVEASPVRELRPLSGRQELLVNLTRPEHLPHHMVLADAVEARFARIEQEYAARARLAEHGLAPRRRVLLYGPSGCGKTFGASRLAWSAGLPLMQVRFDSLVSSLFGETAANLRKVFDHAHRTPSVLLLDECDYIAKSRTARQDVGEVARIVNTLLQLLDEFRGPGLLVATTNIDRELDPALFRRFDDAFLVPLPGPIEIERLILNALSGMEVVEVTWLADAVKDLAGSSAADVTRVARDAAKLAVLEGARGVGAAQVAAALALHRSRETPS